MPTGLEVGAAEECTEALGRPVEPTRGRLTFTLGALEELEKVSEVCIKWSDSTLRYSEKIVGCMRTVNPRLSGPRLSRSPKNAIHGYIAVQTAYPVHDPYAS